MIRAAALLCWLALSCASVRAAQPLIDAYAELPLIANPVLSPDGTRYAALLSGKMRQMLGIVSLAGKPPLTVGISDSDDVQDLEWVNDEWLIVKLATSQKFMGETWRVTRVTAIRATDGKAVSLGRPGDGQHASDVLWIARDGSPRILLAAQQSIYSDEEKFFPEVFEVDVSTGRRISRVPSRSGVMDWFADADGVVRMGISYRDLSRQYRILYREKANEIFRTFDKADLRKGEALVPLPAVFLNEPGKALAFSDHSGFSTLYELDLRKQELGREVFSAPGYDVGGVILDPTGTEVLGVRYTGSRPATQWLEPVMDKIQRDLERALGRTHNVEIVSMSRDQRRLMVLASSSTDAGTYYVMDHGSRSLTPVSKVRPRLQDVAPTTVRTLQYTARDGVKINAILTTPPGQASAPLPLIVMPHGGPHARDDESFDWWAQYVAQLGYAVIQPNFRGSTGYGTAFRELGNGQWGLAMQDDLHDAVDYLAREGIIDPRRVCMVGGSYGGYAALRAAQRDGDKLLCAVSFAGVSDLPAMSRYDNTFFNSGRLRDHRKAEIPDMSAVSPINGVEQIRIPLLLVHGRKDLVVPFTQSSQFAQRMARTGKPLRYVELPDGDHYLSRPDDRRRFLEELTAFLLEHNPVDVRQTAR